MHKIISHVIVPVSSKDPSAVDGDKLQSWIQAGDGLKAGLPILAE